MRGTALDVAERRGALDGIRASATEMSGATTVGARARRTGGFEASAVTAGGRSAELLRGDLVRLVHTRTTAYTEYLYGDSVTAIEQGRDGVRVAFARSGPRVFDLVVGADGPHSTIRRLAFGPEAPHRRFLGSYISIFTVPNHPGLDREAVLFNTPGRLVAMYHTPRAQGAKAMLALSAREENGVDRRSAGEQREFLRHAFAGHGWEADSILEEMQRAADFYFDSVAQIRMDRWSAGRVTLLGDSGYCPSPMSGQDSGLAMVGAYVLAQELARHDGHRAALDAYEARMRPFVAANQGIADRGQAFLLPRTRPALMARGLLLRLAPLLSSPGSSDDRLSRASEVLELDAPAPAGA